MVKMKEKVQDSELFFVEIRDPGEVRRNILETLKEILNSLQRFEKFRGMRQEKLEKIQNLRILVRQANNMIRHLKSKLPQTSLRAAPVREIPKQIRQVPHIKKRKSKKLKEAKEVKTEKQVKIPKKPMTEIEKLESELNAIEGKLKSLS